MILWSTGRAFIDAGNALKLFYNLQIFMLEYLNIWLKLYFHAEMAFLKNVFTQITNGPIESFAVKQSKGCRRSSPWSCCTTAGNKSRSLDQTPADTFVDACRLCFPVGRFPDALAALHLHRAGGDHSVCVHPPDFSESAPQTHTTISWMP